MLIIKFGGSILDGPEGIQRACAEIARLPRPLLVVVSAFADVTNRLERLAETALRDLQAARQELQNLFNDHTQIVRTLVPESRSGEWSQSVEGWKIRMGEIIEGVSIVGELSPRTLDLIVHFGERLSSSILSAVLDVQSVSATDLLITDVNHRFARVDIELSRERVEENLRPLLQNRVDIEREDTTDAAGSVIVTEGYIARGIDGEITTMGRESSDFSASLLGELLGASEVRIYTGVPGVMTADPSVIDSATTIPAMSYGMARELAVLGAKVIHPRTVRPAERGAIPLIITDLSGAATVIGRRGGDETFSVAAINDATLISAELRKTGEEIDAFISEISRTAPVVRYALSGRELRVVTAGTPSNLSDAVAQQSGGIVRSHSVPVALVSVVRERVIDAADARRFVSAIEQHTLLSFWSDPDERSISALVPPDQVTDVLHRLHRQFSVVD